MKVGFFLVDGGPETANAALFARAMVRSSQQSMPRVPVVQFTDMTTPAIKGVSEVRRKPSEPMALLRMRHQAGVQGDWLFVDTDVMIQRPVTNVFKEYAFDVAVTTRNWAHLKQAVGFTERMPFNTGVMFSRSPSFFADAYTRLRQMSPELQQWMGDQEIICDMVQDDACRYQVTHLKGSVYNYPPVVPGSQKGEPIENARIVHYKGPHRKPLLMKRLRELGRCA